MFLSGGVKGVRLDWCRVFIAVSSGRWSRRWLAVNATAPDLALLLLLPLFCEPPAKSLGSACPRFRALAETTVHFEETIGIYIL